MNAHKQQDLQDFITAIPQGTDTLRWTHILNQTCLVHATILCCRPSTAQDHSNAGGRGTAGRQPRQRTTLSRSSSASGALPAPTPRASLSSSDLSRADSSSAVPSRRQSQDTEADTSMAVAAAPLPSARQRPDSRNSVPRLSLGRQAPAQAAAGADGNGPEGSVLLPSARRGPAASKSTSALPGAKRSVQNDAGAPLPSARRGLREVGSSGAQAAAVAPLPSARRGTRDASSSIPLPSARRFTKDESAQPTYTPRQSSDLSSKSGGRWM